MALCLTELTGSLHQPTEAGMQGSHNPFPCSSHNPPLGKVLMATKSQRGQNQKHWITIRSTNYSTVSLALLTPAKICTTGGKSSQIIKGDWINENPSLQENQLKDVSLQIVP